MNSFPFGLASYTGPGLRAYLGTLQLAERVQEGLECPMRDVALELLELLLGEHLHEVVHVQEDAVQVDGVDGLRKEPDHPPQAL